MMGNIIRRTVKDEVERHLSPSSTQKKRCSETWMANLLDKIRKSYHLHKNKMRKVHIKWKWFCFVRNQEFVVPQEKWWISLGLPAIRCDCRYFVKESNRCVFSWWYQCIWWEAWTLSFKVYRLRRKYSATSYTNQGLSR